MYKDIFRATFLYCIVRWSNTPILTDKNDGRWLFDLWPTGKVKTIKGVILLFRFCLVFLGLGLSVPDFTPCGSSQSRVACVSSGDVGQEQPQGVFDLVSGSQEMLPADLGRHCAPHKSSDKDTHWHIERVLCCPWNLQNKTLKEHLWYDGNDLYF